MKILFAVILLVIIARAVPYYVNHSEDNKLSYDALSENDICEFSWSQNTMFSSGCFSFEFIVNEKGKALYGSFQDEKTFDSYSYKYQNISYKEYIKLCDIINSLDVYIPKEKNPDEEEIFALDETTVTIYLVRKNGTQSELRFPNSEKEQELLDLLINLSRKGSKQ